MYRITAITAAAALGLGGGFVAQPASAKPSTFQQTCNKATLAVSDQSVILKASCQKGDGGAWVAASIELTGIANMPAGLAYTGEPHSTFQRSCTNIKVARALISATCQDGRGGTREGSIAIQNIHNIDGVLKYIA